MSSSPSWKATLSSRVGAAGTGAGGKGGAGGGVPFSDGGLGGATSPVLWSATFEPGDLSEWLKDGHGGTYIDNAPVAPAPTLDIAHAGQFAGISTVKPPVAGTASLNYLFRDQPSPPTGYYSAWFYIPPSYTVRGWLSLMHFRCSHTGDGNNMFPIWDVNLIPRTDGSLIAQLFNYVTAVNVSQIVPIPVPISKWVHLEMLLRKAPDATGEIAVWQDGVLIIDLQNVATAETDWVQWDVGGASNDVAPATGVVYIDDAAISTSRLGPNGLKNYQ